MGLFEVEKPQDFSVSRRQAVLKMFVHDRPAQNRQSGWPTSEIKHLLDALFKVTLSEMRKMFRDQVLHMLGHVCVDGVTEGASRSLPFFDDFFDDGFLNDEWIVAR